MRQMVRLTMVMIIRRKSYSMLALIQTKGLFRELLEPLI